MAVYQHLYQQYSGRLTPTWSRFLIIPRYAYQTVFQSRIFTGFFAICFAPLLVMTIMIYFKHNTALLIALNVPLSELVVIGNTFFRVFTNLQTSLAFILAVLIGPVLVSRDLANNALPLYLCRPLTRTDYVIGKMSVLMILLSLMTWIPLCSLFIFQSYLEGAGWMWENLYILRAIFLTSWLWILLLSLLAVALSAWVKWRIAASALLFGTFIVPTPVALMINQLFSTYLGTYLHPSFVLNILTDRLFRMQDTMLPVKMIPPVWSLWGIVAVWMGICLFMLSRKIRAYEVIN